MTLSYETYLEDFVEPSIRNYCRSGLAKKAKRYAVWINVVAGVMVGGILLRGREPAAMLAGALAAGVLMGLLTFLSYSSRMRRRIRKLVERETAGRLPTITTYRIEGERISCDSLGVTYTFSLSDLEEVAESDGYLEISFGKTGLCTIPLRAFESDEQKAAFVALLERGKTAPEA